MAIKTTASKGVDLSARQREILLLLSEGKSNKEIAEALKIGYGTVKQHLFVLFRKLEVTNRAKAVIVANQMTLSRSNHLDGGKTATSSSKFPLRREQSHAWRLVSAVVVSTPDGNFSSPEELDWRNTYLSHLRDILKKFVDALDGQFLMLPYGGMLAWFGYPNTHLDDADRAVQLAQFAQQWSTDYLSQDYALPAEKLTQHAIGIGVSSKPEMSLDKSNEIFASDAFRVAAILARNARAIKLPLTDSLTKKLAPSSVAWLTVKAKALELTQVGDISAIDVRNAMPVDKSALWGDLPFLSGVLDSVKSGVAQWVAVESWPPAVATSLIDALGNRAKLQGFKAIHLRAPSHQRRDKLLNSFIVQAENVVPEFDLQSLELPASVGGGERLGAFFATLAIACPVVIQVYGLKALESLRYVLGERGIERIASRPILVIAANLIESGSPKTAIRLLGPRPVDMPFSRLFSMSAPTQESLPEGIRVDLQAILDDLTPIAQSIVIIAAQDPDRDIDGAIATLNLSQKNSQAALQELTSVGFLTGRQGGGFEFRDLTTAQAIQKLSLPRQ
jgi:DNA-binding CsgD family transcriptional regulator